ncbi:6-aminohexanoate-dimer hydrolase [Polymorphobacter multimanifer]|uniref:CubicO group peptidase (Beta-lactamase class C family) n=1 Tax=Polymorphobacter multimanifer TaxID=1070431 RepID=A0A841L2B7_9SPHN|nr:serine hydrolase [Polymorphobacter multimanifer]MBB6226797.1 CubicO group peptidase (beta-lactamase class C family) [Polymorphobacter multimanifer]GGI67015.1 6-aminohexanoate-dimer hydrolase [Polymorphobacter multimanifer]
MISVKAVIIAVGAIVLCAAASAAQIDPALAKVLGTFDQDKHRDLRGVVVLRDGRLVAERYYNGATPASLNDIRSAGKSVTSLLVGIAIDRGKIRAVDDSVATYWPDSRGSAVGDVKMRDVLTMRSGLAAFDDDAASPGNEDKLDAAADPLAFLRSIPRAHPPGSRYNYNSLTAYAAGVVVAKATGGTMADLAKTALFGPLDIRRWQWASDAGGYTKGQGNLSLTTRDMAKIGEMVRGEGLYSGRRIVSAGWIRDSLASKFSISDSDPFADGYGYFWYSKVHEINGKAVPVSFASGNGGNKIYVIPSRRMVVAITSTAYGQGYGQRRSEAILKAILSTHESP